MTLLFLGKCGPNSTWLKVKFGTLTNSNMQNLHSICIHFLYFGLQKITLEILVPNYQSCYKVFLMSDKFDVIIYDSFYKFKLIKSNCTKCHQALDSLKRLDTITKHHFLFNVFNLIKFSF